jgi:hypothetical protein
MTPYGTVRRVLGESGDTDRWFIASSAGILPDGADAISVLPSGLFSKLDFENFCDRFGGHCRLLHCPD